MVPGVLDQRRRALHHLLNGPRASIAWTGKRGRQFGHHAAGRDGERVVAALADQRLCVRVDDGRGHDPDANGEVGQVQRCVIGDGDDVVHAIGPAIELRRQAYLALGAGLGATAGGVGGKADVPVEG